MRHRSFRGRARGCAAREDEHELFFRKHPTETEREYLLGVFEETGRLPGMKEFFDKKHNPLWLAAPSGDVCRKLWQILAEDHSRDRGAGA